MVYQKIKISFIITFFFLKLSGQQVENSGITKPIEAIISGELTSRLLTWDDFNGSPNDKSAFYAVAYWKIKNNITNARFRKDTIHFNYEAFTELDSDSSWVKKGKETEHLLNHEQGHFNVGKLCAIELTNVIRSTMFLKTEFPGKFQNMYDDILEKYRLMDRQYDLETNHSKDKDNQKRWDDFFKERL